jgi:hypothetical protein
VFVDGVEGAGGGVVDATAACWAKASRGGVELGWVGDIGRSDGGGLNGGPFDAVGCLAGDGERELQPGTGGRLDLGDGAGTVLVDDLPGSASRGAIWPKGAFSAATDPSDKKPGWNRRVASAGSEMPVSRTVRSQAR